MKVVILAAGKGVRLGQGKDNLPKPLTQLSNGKSILEFQIETLSKFISLKEINVVVGYHKEEIIQRFPAIHFVENNNFAHENTAKSLLKGIQDLDDDLLWLNGDVVCHSKAIEKMLSSKQSAMAVNRSKVNDEEIKYIAKDGYILEVSKEVKNGQGEAVGVNFVTKNDLSMFRKALERCGEKDYFEKGLEYAIKDGMKVAAVVIGENDCAEIDFPEDLVRANEMIAGWENRASNTHNR